MGKKEPEFEGKFTGVFVDDEDLVRTGRAWMEVTSGNGVVHIPLSEEHHKLREQVRADAESAASNRKAVDESLRVIKAAESTVLPAAELARESRQHAEASADRADESEKAAAVSQRGSSEILSRVQESQNAVKASEGAAGSSAREASRSEKAAGEYAAQAEASAGDAAEAQKAAERARDTAQKSEQAAGEHVKTSAQAAEQAATYVQGAKAAAEQAQGLMDSVAWEGDRLTVNGQKSGHLTGPKGDTGPKGADGVVTFEALTQQQKESLRGPAGPRGEKALPVILAPQV